MTQHIEGIERVVGEDPDLSIIWLHGLGADATDFLPIVDQLELRTATRFIFPNAPTRPVTINGGMVMRAWYDIIGFGPNAPDDATGITQSIAIVNRLVEYEHERGMPMDRIVLAGFSQGGAVVLHAGLGARQRLGGILGLSTYLPAPDLLRSAETIAADTPVLLAHGTHDPVIPLSLAESSAAILRGLGVGLEWKTYPMAHEVCRQEISDLGAWLSRF